MRLVDLRIKNLPIWVLGLLTVLIPLNYIVDPSFGVSAARVSQEQSFQMAAILLFAVFIVRNIYLGLFLIWSMFLYAFYGFPTPSGSCLLSLFSACILYEISYKVIDQDNIKLLFKIITWFAIANMLYMVMQMFGWELLFREFTRPGFQTGPIGFFGLKAIMGMFIALTIPFIAIESPLVAIGLMVPIALSESSCAVVGGVASYLWILWHKSRKAFVVALTILALGATVYVIKDSHARMMTDRVNMWKVVLRDSVKKPLTGYGLDSFRSIGNTKQFIYWKDVRTLETTAIDVKDTLEWSNTGKGYEGKYPNIKNDDILDPWDNPHNELVMLLFEWGVIGVVLFSFLVYDMRKRFNSFDSNIVVLAGFFICLLILSIGQFPFHLARVGVLIPIMLGAYYKLTDTKKEESLYV